MPRIGADEQWRYQQRCELLVATETVAELLELLGTWLHARHFLKADRARAERLRELVARTARQTEVEWGGASEDTRKLRGAWGRCVREADLETELRI